MEDRPSLPASIVLENASRPAQRSSEERKDRSLSTSGAEMTARRCAPTIELRNSGLERGTGARVPPYRPLTANVGMLCPVFLSADTRKLPRSTQDQESTAALFLPA